MKLKFTLLVILFSMTGLVGHGQQYFRVKAEFSIKENKPDGTQSLTMGTAYYDKVHDKIIYDLAFPEKQTVVISDSVVVIESGKIIEKQKSPNNNQFSIFSLCLNGGLENFGLENSIYKIGETVRENDMIITSWFPAKQLSDKFGKIVISQKKRSIFGIIFFNTEDEVIAKQFFNNYISVHGLKFPTEVVQITYAFGKEFYKQTTFKNIVIDELENDQIYNYRIPFY